MLSAFLPSWLQDLSGAAAALNVTAVANHSLFPLLFLIPVVLVALLLFERNEAAGGSGRPSSLAVLDGATERRSPPEAPAGARPLAAVQSPWSKQPVQAQLPAQPQAPLVLIADDSAVVRGKLSRLLAGAGFRVVGADDGQQALDLIHGGCMPSVLITDLEMPTLDGFELVAAVQGALETEHLPIIAITGHDDLQARVADLSGIYGIFKKPWNDRALIRRVQALATMAEASV